MRQFDEHIFQVGGEGHPTTNKITVLRQPTGGRYYPRGPDFEDPSIWFWGFFPSNDWVWNGPLTSALPPCFFLGWGGIRNQPWCKCCMVILKGFPLQPQLALLMMTLVIHLEVILNFQKRSRWMKGDFTMKFFLDIFVMYIKNMYADIPSLAFT